MATVGDRTFRLVFRHEGTGKGLAKRVKDPGELAKAQRKMVKARKRTTATVLEVLGEGEVRELASATVTHFYMDPYSKELGRQFALKKLLRLAGGFEEWHDHRTGARHLVRRWEDKCGSLQEVAPVLTEAERAAIHACYVNRGKGGAQ